MSVSVCERVCVRATGPCLPYAAALGQGRFLLEESPAPALLPLCCMEARTALARPAAVLTTCHEVGNSARPKPCFFNNRKNVVRLKLFPICRVRSQSE